MKVIGQLAIVAVLAAAGGAAYYYRDALPIGGWAPQAAPGGGGGAREALPVQVVAARLGAVTETVESVGTAFANEAVTITTKTTGIVSKILFTEGQAVRAGSVLVELDGREVIAELEASRAVQENAQLAYERATKLLETRNVPQARVDELASSLKGAEARVKVTEARLADLRIVAPFSGKLGMRRVSLGALISPGTAITTLDDVETIKLYFSVPETVLANLRVNVEVQARSEAYPGRAFVGRVRTIDSRVDAVTRAVEVRADVANADGALKPGMFLTVSLGLTRRDNAVLIPEEALVPIGSRQYVFVAADGKAVRTEVRLGQRLAGEVEVVAGIAAGAQVITGGLQRIRDGSAVRIQTRPIS